MKIPDIAILDGDLMAYKAACFAEKEGAEELEARLRFDINLWTPSEINRVMVAFSPSRTNNYRRDFWPQYKAHRDSKATPEYLPRAIEILSDITESVRRPRIEADDIIGIGMSSGLAIGVTLDKDLRSCPGWLWNPEKQGFPELISELEADRWFHRQWLTGDGTDRIPGIHRLGEKGAEKMLDACTPENWSAMVMDHYEKTAEDWVKWKFDGATQEGTRADMLRQVYLWEDGQNLEYCLAQARCVRILRDGEWDKVGECPILFSPPTIQA